MLDNKDIEFWKNLSIKNDIYEISKIICKYLNSKFDIDLTSIYLLETDKTLKRLWLEYSDFNEKEIDENFSHFDLPLDRSLAGLSILEKRKIKFSSIQNGNFKNFLKNEKLESIIYKESIENVTKIFTENNKDLKNLYIVPIIGDSENKENGFPIFNIKISITFINITNFEENITKINEILQLIKPILYNSISFHYSKEESEINRKINFLENSNSDFENVIDTIQNNFAKKLKATTSSYWYYDDTYKLLNINNIKCFADDGVIDFQNTQKLFLKFNSLKTRVIDGDNKFINKLKNKIISLRKFYSKNELLEIFPQTIIEILPSQNGVILPLFSNGFFGFLFFQTNLSSLELEKISNSYYVSFLKQATLLFKFKEGKRFKYSSIEMNTKILKLTKKNPEIIYKEILYKLKSLINCEAVSIFSIKGSQAYLEATTDNSEKAKSKIGKYLYKADSKSITGYCMKIKEDLNIFSVEKVNTFYKSINSHSTAFVETVDNNDNTTLLLIPFFKSDENIFIIRAKNKLNSISNNPFKTTNFSKNDADIIRFAGSIFQNYKEIFEGINDRNKLLSLLLHEVESPIKHIRNKVRKIYRSNVSSKDENNIISNVIDDITRNLELIRGWASNVETINILFQGRQLSPQMKRIDLNGIIHNSIYWKKDVLKRTHRELSVINTKYLNYNLFVNGDESHYYQIFLNLLENSIKYSGYDSSEPSINIYSVNHNDYIELYIEDFGIGIEKDEINKIFELQYRSKTAKEKNYKGEGYGLWLTEKLLNANNSIIEVDNLKNPTRFKITIKKNKK